MLDRVEVAWCLPPAASEADAQAALDALAETDPAAELTLLPAGDGMLPVDLGAIITGTIAIAAVAGRVVDLVCRLRKSGLIVDARGNPMRITESDQLPGGVVLTIAADETQSLYDVCSSKVDLPGLLKALASRDDK